MADSVQVFKLPGITLVKLKPDDYRRNGKWTAILKSVKNKHSNIFVIDVDVKNGEIYASKIK